MTPALNVRSRASANCPAAAGEEAKRQPPFLEVNAEHTTDAAFVSEGESGLLRGDGLTGI